VSGSSESSRRWFCAALLLRGLSDVWASVAAGGEGSKQAPLPRRVPRVRVPPGPGAQDGPGIHLQPPRHEHGPGGPQYRGMLLMWSYAAIESVFLL